MCCKLYKNSMGFTLIFKESKQTNKQTKLLDFNIRESVGLHWVNTDGK